MGRDLSEQLRETTENGADPEVIYQAADLLDKLFAYVDVLHGKGEIRHAFNGLCPDETQPDSRDDECPACRLLLEIEK